MNDDDSIVDGDCRTFDVKDTGRISESKFRQILATKQVPKEDVDGILEGETVAHRVKYQQSQFSEYRKLEVAPSDTSSVDGSEEQILYKGEHFSGEIISKQCHVVARNQNQMYLLQS